MRAGGKRSARIVAMLGLVAIAGVLASCDLPRATANALCKGNGYAQDGTYILKCTNGRWKRGITVEAGDKALNLWLESLKPPPAPVAPVPAPPAPPRSDFGYGKRPVGTGPDQVPPGLYTTLSSPSSQCGTTHYGPDGSVRSTGVSYGRNFAEVRAGDTFVEGLGSCVWTPAPAGPATYPFGDGRYRVGVDIAPGVYKNTAWYESRPGVIGGGTGLGWECNWRRLGGVQGPELESGWATQIFTVTIQPTDVVFQSQSCGTWNRIG